MVYGNHIIHTGKDKIIKQMAFCEKENTDLPHVFKLQ
jgi:hypothetical protein